MKHAKTESAAIDSLQNDRHRLQALGHPSRPEKAEISDSSSGKYEV